MIRLCTGTLVHRDCPEPPLHLLTQPLAQSDSGEDLSGRSPLQDAFPRRQPVCETAPDLRRSRLDIPDSYGFIDPELVELLADRIEQLLPVPE